jgi:hypothetical protein
MLNSRVMTSTLSVEVEYKAGRINGESLVACRPVSSGRDSRSSLHDRMHIRAVPLHKSLFFFRRWTVADDSEYYTVCPQSPFGVLKNCGAQTN